MRFTRNLSIILCFLVSSIGHADYEAHEWGTFTSLVGSNGITQNGMYHEDEALPDFVHGFGELRDERHKTLAFNEDPEPDPRPPCRGKGCFGDFVFQNNIITQKMETPVIYFYTRSPIDVNVNVRFPEGVVTETYPGPVSTFPNQRDTATIANGNTTFQVHVSTAQSGPIPNVPRDNIYSHARNVDSNIVTSGRETEKFIFYRGIGRFQPRLGIESVGSGLTIRARTGYVPQAAFLVHVDSELRTQGMNLGQMSVERVVSIPIEQMARLRNHSVSPNREFLQSGALRNSMISALITSGLNRDEAVAMLDTWENGYLKVPGLRLLYILPRNEVDQVLPLTLTPAPRSLVRSFVGRIEIMLAQDEQNLISDIESLGPSFRSEGLGRFAEPMLRRAQEVYSLRKGQNPNTVRLIENLIRRTSQPDVGTTATQ